MTIWLWQKNILRAFFLYLNEELPGFVQILETFSKIPMFMMQIQLLMAGPWCQKMTGVIRLSLIPHHPFTQFTQQPNYLRKLKTYQINPHLISLPVFKSNVKCVCNLPLIPSKYLGKISLQLQLH